MWSVHILDKNFIKAGVFKSDQKVKMNSRSYNNSDVSMEDEWPMVAKVLTHSNSNEVMEELDPDNGFEELMDVDDMEEEKKEPL